MDKDKKITWKVDIPETRYFPETVDKASKGFTATMNGALYNLASLIKHLKNQDHVSKIEALGLGDGMLHAFAAEYDVDGEVAKFQSEDPDELTLYKEAFLTGFKAGMLTNWSVDTHMRKGLGFENYQPIVFTEDEL